LVAKPTDTQKLLPPTTGKGNRDHLRLTWQQHRFEAHDCMLLGATVSTVDAPAIELSHPVRNR
jgi:hypothetical protein